MKILGWNKKVHLGYNWDTKVSMKPNSYNQKSFIYLKDGFWPKQNVRKEVSFHSKINIFIKALFLVVECHTDVIVRKYYDYFGTPFTYVKNIGVHRKCEEVAKSESV